MQMRAVINQIRAARRLATNSKDNAKAGDPLAGAFGRVGEVQRPASARPSEKGIGKKDGRDRPVSASVRGRDRAAFNRQDIGWRVRGDSPPGGELGAAPATRSPRLLKRDNSRSPEAQRNQSPGEHKPRWSVQGRVLRDSERVTDREKRFQSERVK